MIDAGTIDASILADVLVRFVWQGVAIAALAWAALLLLRHARPQARYAVACLALLSCALVPATGLLQALVAGDVSGTTGIGLPLQDLGAALATDADGGASVVALTSIASPWIVIAWAAGVIVLSLRTGDGVRECGIVVDKVLDVVDVPNERIRPAPATPGTAAGECISGMAMLEERMLILLDAASLVFMERPQRGADAAA